MTTRQTDPTDPTAKAGTADAATVVADYLAVATPGRLDTEAMRGFLTDDVVVDDPLMSFESADGFLAALGAVDLDDQMGSTVQEIVGGGEVAAARVLFEAEGMTVQFSQWFWLTDGKISRIQVIYDPRPFLDPSA